MTDRQTVIVFALFPGVTQLDFTGPHEVFSALPGASVILASAEGGVIEASGGMTFTGLRRLGDIPECDVVCVPGGRGATDNAIGDEVFLAELRRLAATARYVTSVCTGALVLGAAGLLRGRRAATHWAWRELLAPFGATADPARVVRDGNVITGGGVTAGHRFCAHRRRRPGRPGNRPGDPAADRIRARAAIRRRLSGYRPAGDPGAGARTQRGDGRAAARRGRSRRRPPGRGLTQQPAIRAQ